VRRRRIAAERFARAVNYSIDTDDWAIAVLEDRVSAIEEIIAARWLRSLLLRRRLARGLRTSASTFAWAGDSFRARRAEQMSEDIEIRSRPSGCRCPHS
jgi:hypothetical protein